MKFLVSTRTQSARAGAGVAATARRASNAAMARARTDICYCRPRKCQRRASPTVSVPASFGDSHP